MHGSSPTVYNLFNLIHIPEEYSVVFYPVAAAVLVFIILYIFMYIIGKTYSRSNSIVPSNKLSVTNVFEMMIEGLNNFYESILGDHSKDYAGFLNSIFIFILFGNLIGMIPGFLAPTAVLPINAIMALMVFVYYQYVGFKKHGVSYLKTFVGPLWWLAVLMIPTEIMSHLARPLSLTLRLTGNMSGEHTVIGIFTGMIPIGVPVIFMLFGLLIAALQAFVFTTLSTIYILLAIEIDH